MAITAAKTLSLLAKHGVDAVFRVYGTDSYDPTTGITTHAVPADHTHKIVPPYKSGSSAMERFGGVDGVVIADAFSAVSPSGMTITPAVGMEVIYDSKTWIITAVNVVRTEAEIVLYELALASKAG